MAVSLEIGRQAIAQSELQNALDTAILAGAVKLAENPADNSGALEAAKAAFDVNTAKRALGSAISVAPNFTIDGGTIKGAANGRINTILGGIVGVPALNLNADNAARFPTTETTSTSTSTTINQTSAIDGPLEISLMLDTTASMEGAPLAALKEGASEFVRKATSAGARVAIVPFSDSVRVPAEAALNATNGMSYGCVAERPGADSRTDAPPGPGSSFGPVPKDWGCHEASTLVPLTRDGEYLASVIAGFVKDGSTAGHIGTAWTWYTLSPKWNQAFAGTSNDAAPYGAARKIAVLMTDGAYNTYYQKRTRIPTLPYFWTEEPWIETSALCDNMKAAGIQIYTIGFRLNAKENSKLAQCASDAEFSYSTDKVSGLVDAFRSIVASATTGIATPTVTQTQTVSSGPKVYLSK